MKKKVEKVKNKIENWHNNLSVTLDSYKELLSLSSHTGELAALRKGQIPPNGIRWIPLLQWQILPGVCSMEDKYI